MKKLILLVLVVGLCMFLTSPVFAKSICVDGVDGKDGIDGVDGVNGINGINGVDGRDGNDYEREDSVGLGIDLVLYEQGDPNNRKLENLSWLKSLTIEYRCDMNQDHIVNETYLVGRIKLWNK